VLSEKNKFQDETVYWKISGFDHAWPLVPYLESNQDFLREIFGSYGTLDFKVIIVRLS
jgi:hypothetical protein